jgi:hypothetical protein
MLSAATNGSSTSYWDSKRKPGPSRSSLGKAAAPSGLERAFSEQVAFRPKCEKTMARTNTRRLVTTGAVMARCGSASGSCFRAGASGLRAWGRRSAPAGDQKHVSDNPDRCRSDARRTPHDEFWTAGCHWIQRVARTVVCTENCIRVDDVIESPKLAE